MLFVLWSLRLFVGGDAICDAADAGTFLHDVLRLSVRCSWGAVSAFLLCIQPGLFVSHFLGECSAGKQHSCNTPLCNFFSVLLIILRPSVPSMCVYHLLLLCVI